MSSNTAQAGALILDAIDEHLHGDTSGAGDAVAAAVRALVDRGLLLPDPDPQQRAGARSAALLVEVVPVGQPGRVAIRVTNIGPHHLAPVEQVRLLHSAVDTVVARNSADVTVTAEYARRRAGAMVGQIERCPICQALISEATYSAGRLGEYEFVARARVRFDPCGHTLTGAPATVWATGWRERQYTHQSADAGVDPAAPAPPAAQQPSGT